MLLECYLRHSPGSIEKVNVEMNYVPRKGEYLEIDQVEYEVSSVLYVLAHSETGPQTLKTVLINLR